MNVKFTFAQQACIFLVTVQEGYVVWVGCGLGRIYERRTKMKEKRRNENRKAGIG